jgi:hypothetical protein
MRLSSAACAVLFVLALLAGSTLARADEGAVTLVIFKAGWFFGGSAGTGVFGGSQTTLQGRVRNIRRAQDIAGVYAAAGAGVAFGAGVRGIVLTNQNGAILELSGKQLGLIANLDLSGLAVSLKQ